MKITSLAFEENGFIPSKYTCDGYNISPPLEFSNVPKETKSLILIMDDPDAPNGTFVHWVVWNILPNTKKISEGEKLTFPQGKTDFGKSGYDGPCPPSGIHKYFFKLYALDGVLNIKPNSNKEEVERVMEGHIIEKAQLIGRYGRKIKNE